MSDGWVILANLARAEVSFLLYLKTPCRTIIGWPFDHFGAYGNDQGTIATLGSSVPPWISGLVELGRHSLLVERVAI